MKTRLAFQLDENEADYRAAASRIGVIEVVAPDENPDALVASARMAAGLPTLLVGAIPSVGSGNEFAALPLRFCPQVRAIRASLDAGQLGRPGLLRLHRWSPPGRDPGKVAAVDLALWLIGEQPVATHRTRSSNNDVIHLGFPSGAMALLDFTDALPAGDGYHSLCLVGSNGAAYADDHRDRNLFFTGGAPGAAPPDFSKACLRPMLEDFVTAVREKRSPEHTTRDLLRARQLVEEAMA